MADTGTPADGGNTGTGQGTPTYTPPATQADFDRMAADRINRERAKYADYADLKAKAAKFDAAEEAAKTENQKLTDQIAKLTGEVEAYKTAQQRVEWVAAAAKKTGLPVDTVSRLGGSTAEELEANATAVVASLKTQSVGHADPADILRGTVPSTPAPSDPADQVAAGIRQWRRNHT